MLTRESLLSSLAERLEQAAELEYQLANLESEAPEETLLFRLTGLNYPGFEGESSKAITAAGGMAQSLERQDLETKITSASRLIEEDDDEEED